MNATIETHAAVNGSAPSQAPAKETKSSPQFSALDSIRASVDLAKGPGQFVATALDNARALGLPVGNLDRSKLASAIGRILAESRENSSKFTSRGGKSATVESFDWQALAKQGLLTPLQATTLAAVGAIAATVDKVRRARNASL